jgi:hypothetical protein
VASSGIVATIKITPAMPAACPTGGGLAASHGHSEIMFRVAADVAHLQVGARRIEVPWHGYVVVAWKAPLASGLPARPPIAAIGEDGSRLTELGPHDHLDSLTWAAVEGN